MESKEANTVSDAVKDKYVFGDCGSIGLDRSSYSHTEQEKMNNEIIIKYNLLKSNAGVFQPLLIIQIIA
jgi:hypothetical protein